MILITIFANCAALAAYEPLPEKDSSEINDNLVGILDYLFALCGILFFMWMNIHAVKCGSSFNLLKISSVFRRAYFVWSRENAGL